MRPSRTVEPSDERLEVAQARKQALEDAANLCHQIWQTAASERERNALSHGCIASAKAIRGLIKS